MNSSPTILTTPVAFCIYNRPAYTAQVFARIRAAQPARLLVVADGPKAHKPGDAEQVAATRAVVAQIDWPCEVSTEFAPANLGCRRRMASGLDWVFATVEEAIILEDDCVPHPDFFKFAQVMLERYRHDARIMMVQGSNFEPQVPVDDDYFFSRYFAIWGWATWRRAWRHYQVDLPPDHAHREQRWLTTLLGNPHVAAHYMRHFQSVRERRLDTWDVQWTYTCLFQHGLSLVPRTNLISNIGEVGTHMDTSAAENTLLALSTQSLDTDHLRHPTTIFPQLDYDDAMYRHRLPGGPIRHLCTRVMRRLRRYCSGGSR